MTRPKSRQEDVYLLPQLTCGRPCYVAEMHDITRHPGIVTAEIAYRIGVSDLLVEWKLVERLNSLIARSYDTDQIK